MWLNKLEEKFGRYAIPNLPKIIVLLYAVGFVIANHHDYIVYWN